MVFASQSERQHASIISGSDVVLIGPGLGCDAWAEQLLDVVLKHSDNIILDADALNLLTEKKIAALAAKSIISTPHPGEAAGLLSVSSKEVQQDRFNAAQAIQGAIGGITILKGNGTIVFDGQSILLCGYGNQGMATAGMDHVLA